MSRLESDEYTHACISVITSAECGRQNQVPIAEKSTHIILLRSPVIVPLLEYKRCHRMIVSKPSFSRRSWGRWDLFG